jgi:hypothetical protein
MGVLRCDFAFDETSDALVERVVAHSTDVSGADGSRQDAAQPRPSLGRPLKLDREHPVRRVVGRSDRCAVRKVQSWVARRC